jgi:hypothetical protein
MPPQAARTAGPPRTRTRRCINPAKRSLRRGCSTPPRAMTVAAARAHLLLQVVADCTRLSAVKPQEVQVAGDRQGRTILD